MKWTKFSASSIIRSLCDSSWDMSSKAGKETIPKEYSKNTPRILQEWRENQREPTLCTFKALWIHVYTIKVFPFWLCLQYTQIVI